MDRFSRGSVFIDLGDEFLLDVGVGCQGVGDETKSNVCRFEASYEENHCLCEYEKSILLKGLWAATKYNSAHRWISMMSEMLSLFTSKMNIR